MSLLGKILAFLNVLGVTGVLALGLMTYAKKQTWATAVAQQDLRLAGLPLSSDEFDEEGYPRTDNVTDEIIKGVIPGTLVRTQVEEVERVHNLLQQKIDEAADPPAKLLLLTQALEPFTTDYNRYTALILIRRWMSDPQLQATLKDQLSKAAREADAALKEIADLVANPDPKKQLDRAERTWDEAYREFANVNVGGSKIPFVLAHIKARAADPNAGFEVNFATALEDIRKGLQADLDAVYTAAKTGELTDLQTGESKRCGPGVQKLYVVRYLYNAAPFAEPEKMAATQEWAPQAIKRVVAVVGLEVFPGVLLEQASRIGTLTAQLRSESGLPTTVTAEIVKQIERERSEFAARHNRMIDYLRQQAGLIEDRTARLTRATATAAEHEKLRDSSKELNDGLEKALATGQAETAEVVKSIREMTRDLFDIRLKTRDAARLNQNLESEIRRQERFNRE